jgi:hypothetical protein
VTTTLIVLCFVGIGLGLLYLAVDALSHINQRLAELGRLIEGIHQVRSGGGRGESVELRAPGVQTLGVDMLQAHVSELRRQLDELRMVVNSMLAEQREAREEPHPHG